jgi:hypothetical protein
MAYLRPEIRICGSSRAVPFSAIARFYRPAMWVRFSN